MAIIADKLQQLHERLARACAAAARPVQSVTLLAVSKTFEADAVRAAFACGERRFGENYVQEGVDKIAALADVRSQIEWHLIGPLQSNKTRVVAEQFDWVHSVDRLKTAQRLSEQRPAHLAPLQVCLQVNISGEASKRGLRPDAVAALARAVAALPRLTLRGLMAVPEPAANFEAQRAPHRALHALMLSLQMQGLDQGQGQVQRPVLDTLSMGMSADLEAAVMEGATLVRVGSAIFGPRPALKPIGPPLV
jgi:PLP dependent protein